MDLPSLFCSIRKEWVVALPEEIVRQRILLHMIEEKGFPASLIAVEQSLRLLPHLSSQNRQRVPNRRADIVCFAKGINPDTTLYPLIMIECKSIKLVPSIMSQIVGYNHYVGSCFIGLANQVELRTGWYDAVKKDYSFIEFLPSYEDLIKTRQSEFRKKSI